jgi:hypothetical protein
MTDQPEHVIDAQATVRPARPTAETYLGDVAKEYNTYGPVMKFVTWAAFATTLGYMALVAAPRHLGYRAQKPKAEQTQPSQLEQKVIAAPAEKPGEKKIPTGVYWFTKE